MIITINHLILQSYNNILPILHLKIRKDGINPYISRFVNEKFESFKYD